MILHRVMVSFTQIPNTLLVPFVGVEFNSSQATQGSAPLPYKALLIGQKLSSGAAAADTLVRVFSIGDVIAATGRGSELHDAATGWYASNTSTELWLGVLADNGAGVAATGTIVFTSAATGAGTISFYLGGVLVTVGVNSGDATTAMATNTAAAINAKADLPVTAGVSSSTVTITFRHKGLIGNSYDVRANFNIGDAAQSPAGAAWTITAMASGTTAPSLTNLIAAMSDMWFQIWSHPYTDATSLTAIETELALRLGAMRSQDGVAFTSANGPLSALTTLGTGRNSPSSSIVAQTGVSTLTPPWRYAAEVAAIVAREAQIDPARPFQTLAMLGALATAPTDKFDATERDLLLHDGIATTKHAPGGGVQLDRLVTTYQLNASGQPDSAYRDVTTMLNLLYLRFDFRNRITSKYGRYKLADDGTRFDPGQPVMTPSLGRAEALQWFRDNEAAGRVQNFEAFKANLDVRRNASDPNRLDYLLPPQLMSQLIVTAAQIQFRL